MKKEKKLKSIKTEVSVDSPEEETGGHGGNDLQQMEFKACIERVGVMDDESDDSTNWASQNWRD